MKNHESKKDAFLAELDALLKKFDATLECRDCYQGWPECGEDIRMFVCIPDRHENDEIVQHAEEIDLGHSR